jgi:inward rectifier potassium channel
MDGIPKGARPTAQPGGYTYWVVGGDRALLRDAYHTFLRLPWGASLALIALALIVVNLAFATLYYVVGGVDGVSGSYWDAFVFSVQTLGTIGYGVMVPRSTAANTLMIIESITSVIVIALATGLVFSKFARATARVAFSQDAVIAKRNGKPTLTMRVGNRRSNVIVEARVRITAGFTRTTLEGEPFYEILDLKLVRERISGLRRGWVVMHVVDETSPLYGKTAADLAAEEVELEVSLTGFDDVTMQTVHALHSYMDRQIKIGYRFEDTLRALPNGDLLVDLTQFDAVVPEDTPRDSVRSA